MSRPGAWAALEVEGHGWLNATASLASGGGVSGGGGAAPSVQVGLPSPRNAAMMVLTAHVPASAADGVDSVSERADGVPPRVTGSAYGWGPIPMLSVYDRASGLPVLPWNRSLP